MTSGPVSRNLARLTYGCTSVSTSRVARLLSGDMMNQIWTGSWTFFGLFRLEVSRFDDRPPLLDLGLLKITERAGRLPPWRWNVLAKIVQARAYCCIGERSYDGRVELLDD